MKTTHQIRFGAALILAASAITIFAIRPASYALPPQAEVDGTPISPIVLPLGRALSSPAQGTAVNPGELYNRIPILGPLTSGGPAQALAPPSDDEVLRALDKSRRASQRGLSLAETQRKNVRIVKVIIADYIDPPRKVPLIGMAQLHHAHYKASISYTEVKRIGWAAFGSLSERDIDTVLYLDHNHFHMVEERDETKRQSTEYSDSPE